ncbi:MAG: hypothetical protein WKG00_17485 [Polyangiaceae bacterium]
MLDPRGDHTRGRRAHRSPHALRTFLAAAALLFPLALFTLITRQSSRLEALADHGRATEAYVTGVSRDGRFTHYAYRVHGIEHDWNVARADAPYALGERFTASYLPEDPALTRPWVDPPRAAAEATAGRSVAWKAALGLATLLGIFAAAVHVDLHRARAGVPAAPPDLRTYRRRLVVSSVVLAIAFALVSGLHARDAVAKGESLAPVFIAMAIAVAIVAAIFIPAARHGPAAAQLRSARILRWAVPLAIGVALVRLVIMLVSR